MPPVAIGRLLGLITATVLLAAAGYCFWVRHEGFSRFAQWQLDRPFQGAVDLSRPGRYQFPYRHTCVCSHGEMIELMADPAIADEPAWREKLTGLRGQFTIVNDRGDQVMREAFDAEGAFFWNGPSVCQLVYFRPQISTGEYQIILNITAGASGLAGVAQRIQARYHLCGCEILGATIIGLFGYVLAGVGLLVGVFQIPGLWRHGLRRAPLAQQP